MKFDAAHRAVTIEGKPAARIGWSRTTVVFELRRQDWTLTTDVICRLLGEKRVEGSIRTGSFIAILRGGVIKPYEPTQQDIDAEDWVVL